RDLCRHAVQFAVTRSSGRSRRPLSSSRPREAGASTWPAWSGKRRCCGRFRHNTTGYRMGKKKADDGPSKALVQEECLSGFAAFGDELFGQESQMERQHIEKGSNA